MKTINQYIQEKFIINKNTKSGYKYFPKTKEELKEILEKRLLEDKNTNLNDINVSGITDMGELFMYLDPHNIDISEWDVSKVENMSYMFFGCRNFNSDLSNWKVSKVKNMNNMFFNCKSLKNIPTWYKK